MKTAPIKAPASKPQPRTKRRRNVAWAAPQKMRAAFYAGMGMSGAQISAECGIPDPQKVRAMLRTYGIKLLRDAGTMELIMVRVPRDVAVAITALADRHDMLPEEFAARTLTVMSVDEPVILTNLLNDGAPA